MEEYRMRGPLVPSWITLVLVSSLGNGATAWCSETRSYNGSGNNCDNPRWGSANISQIRVSAQANYSDGISDVSRADRPSAREVTTKIFSKAPVSGSPKSALFVAWGQLVSFDLFKNKDNFSEPFNVSCQTGFKDKGKDDDEIDIWCPLGEESDSIPFYRSDAELDLNLGVRQPLNYATAYLDLDFVYGRSEDDAKTLREMEKGLMKLDNNMPVRFDNGTWLIADNRTTQFPVTFALHTMFLLEHNRCCEDVAPGFGFEEDEEIFQQCRANTIAAYQHITKNDFIIRLLGMDVASESENGLSMSPSSSSGSKRSLRDQGGSKNAGDKERDTGKKGSSSDVSYDLEVLYNASMNAGTDVFFSTVGAAAFHAAIPPTIRIMNKSYIPVQQDGIELVEAVENLEEIFRKHEGVAMFIRGAALSPSLAIDAHFASTVSTVSKLFKLPIDGIQRGRDHGIPNYNDARAAYNLSRASSFADITSDKHVEKRLEDVYGGDISKLDALTGALVEGNRDTVNLVFGELLSRVWGGQMHRTMTGDRFGRNISDAFDVPNNLTLKELIRRSVNITDLSDAPFVAPEVMVCYENCNTDSNLVALSSEFSLGWDILSDDEIELTVNARSMGSECYLAIGFGGTTMIEAGDYLVCTVIDGNATCVDRAPVSSRATPLLDSKNSTLEVIGVSAETEMTSVTFRRRAADLNLEEDYDIFTDIEERVTTKVIYAFNDGEFALHPNANRGAAEVDFSLGTSSTVCEEDQDFFLLHGALILIAWMFFATAGIYYARYCKGEMVSWGSQWWQRHAELMIVASELVLPLSISAIFSTQDNFSTSHARWGLYMIGAIVMQLATGWLRVKALEGKHHNFSLFHRFNKYFHIWCGRFAYLAGIVECYRGLELVSSTDNLVFTTYDINYEVGSFGDMYTTIFPIWAGVTCFVFLVLEARMQIRRIGWSVCALPCLRNRIRAGFYEWFEKVVNERVPAARADLYKREGAARLFGIFYLRNNSFVPGDNGEGEEGERRMMARTDDLPLYSMEEFNYKVLHGESWVIVDGAILDISRFYGRHPGGSRVIMNALGTDITGELIGEDRSTGNTVSFSPQHPHSKDAWGIARTLVVGYIHEGEDGVDDESEDRDSSIDGDFYSENESSARYIEKEGEFRQDNNIYRNQPRETSSTDVGGRDGLAALNMWSANDRSKPFNLSERRGFTLAFTADGSPGLALTAISRSTASSKSGISRATARSEAITRAWEEKARRNRAAGAHTESPAELLQPSTSLVPGFSRREVERGKFVLDRYHVCPFVLRERLDDDADSLRPIYRYVFSCPGEAAALTLVQRSYNVSAVRVVEVPLPADRVQTASFFSLLPAPQFSRRKSLPKVGARKPPKETIGLPAVNESQQEEESDLEDYATKRRRRAGGGAILGETISRSLDKKPLAPRATTSSSSSDGTVRRNVPFSSVFSWFAPAFSLNFTRSKDTAVTDFGAITARQTSTPAPPNASDTSSDSAERTVLKVVPADESPYGDLCIEMRIRLYPDGAMSRLLEQLAHETDNAAVQLQGPYPTEKLGAPPAYPNVIMIAAGTGINPMVQLIRDYQSFERADAFPKGVRAGSSAGAAKPGASRMSLIWQVAKSSEFYCLEELESLEAKMRGRLEVTTIVNCDDGRLANGSAAPMSFLRPRNNRSLTPTLENADGEKSRGVEHHSFKNLQGANRDAFFFLSNSGENVGAPRESSRQASVNAKEGDAVFSFPLEDGSTAAAAEKIHATMQTSGQSEEGAIATGAQERRLNQGRRRKYFANGVDAEATDFVVISPGGSSQTVDQSGNRSGHLTNSSRRSDRSNSSSKAVQIDGRSSFFQQDSGQSRFLGAKAASNLPDASRLRLQRMDEEGKGATAERVLLKPMARRAKSTGNLPTGSAWNSQAEKITCRPCIGKVTKAHLKDALGDELVRELGELKRQRRRYRASSSRGERKSHAAGGGADDIPAKYMSAVLHGYDSLTSKLQVVVSGPSGFVFKVEAMLDEVGVPPEVIVGLD